MLITIVHFLKVGLAMGLGLFIGWERENQDKPAGIRDVTLVTLGATVFTILALELINIASQYQLSIRYDIGRIIAYVIVSIGFLGSGVIIQTKDKLEGITTASMLWTMVGTGLLIGIGHYSLAIVLTLCIYFILKLKHIRIYITRRRRRCRRKRK